VGSLVARVLVAYGTRPEAVKLGPLVLALEDDPDLEPIVCVTAQHRVMLDQFNAIFGIEPDHDLDLLRPRQTLTHVTSGVLEGMETVLEQVRPDAVVVQGDTTTTLAAALAGFYQKVPVVHVEAGLRTGDRYSPYPEELNRRLTTQLATLHLAPTVTSRANLLREGVAPKSVIVTGNTVIDALHWVLKRVREPRDPALRSLMNDPRRLLLVTSHRRESWGQPMRDVGAALRRLAQRYADMVVVLPLHKNPVVREALLPAIEDLPNVMLLEPLEYDDFAWCLQRAHVVLSDSGGVQEEAPALGKPVLVLRENTERPEAVEAGTVKLVGTATDTIEAEVVDLWEDAAAYEAMSRAVNPYGDGRAVERSVAALRHLLLGADRPKEFAPHVM
jgi:UDP-N-acetylglucosamine 2-epimerase (non-hydrolysing)